MSGLIDRVRGDYRKVPAQRTPLQALPLRPYQRQALDAVAEKIREGVRRPAVVLPTGSGKTFVFAHDAKEWLAEHPDDRVLVLVDLDELVWQTVKELAGVAPHLSVGVVKAERNEVNPSVIVASVQSLRNPARLAEITGVTRIIVDECEAAVSPTYMAVLEHFGCFSPDGAVAIGYTATLVRGDGKSLFPVWQEVAFTRDLSWMVRKGYLIPPRGIAVEVPDLDLGAVKATRTDYQDGELGEALAESLAPELVAKAYAEHAADRRGILFAPTVASAYVFADAMNAAGISADVVHGGMPLGSEENPEPGTRRYVFQQHKAGAFQVLCNCMIATKGYNDPKIGCVVMARPTKSARLYRQCIGRGLRVDPERPYGDQDCLILDVVGANAIHDLRTVIDLSERKIDPDRAHSGRTLVELEDELDAFGGVEPDEPELYHGPVRAREFDPLGRPSTRVWIRTAGGTYFVPAGKHGYVFVMQWPEPGRWSVAWCSARSGDKLAGVVPAPDPNGRQVGMTEHRGLPLDQALVWAEDLALDMGAESLNTASKSAPWRKKVASEKLRGLALNLGLQPEPGVRAGVLSDQVTEIMGTRRIDPIVQKVKGR